MAFVAFGSQAPAQEQKPTKTGRVALILLLPGLFYLALFFITPLISLIITSLKQSSASGAIGRYDYGFELGNYAYAVSQYAPQIFRSFSFALLATIIALAISYPIAYFIGVKARDKPLLQGILLTLVVAPFFISFLLRTFAWKQIFSNDSFIVNLLKNIGVFGADSYIIGTNFAVVFGLVYNFIPFMTLPIYANLDRLDIRLLEAGSDLYASPAKTFQKVTLPLSLPGVISGTLLTFIPISGDYVVASRDFLGGPDTAMIGNVVEANFLRIQDYPTASALSVMLMATIVLLVSAYVKRSGTEDLL
ncbi:MAG: ABC transporter permease [Micrococcales bacterium]|jgi:spermidine/putrescine transport system permease protein|nr:ABC transporter permease [Micrococcales bacterium]MBT5397719.1 ABC transporter permease [Micrococcales bacterium]MBT5431559.1 ABC transporter permease [Micrococcales bacterium]MBT5847947.1 ABC transporter permease [Micrococcales bacterium]MBT7925715.1 ABC transporter permease [Micrococcales bacterium]